VAGRQVDRRQFQKQLNLTVLCLRIDTFFFFDLCCDGSTHLIVSFICEVLRNCIFQNLCYIGEAESARVACGLLLLCLDLVFVFILS
jgi:hypothetical protein